VVTGMAAEKLPPAELERLHELHQEFLDYLRREGCKEGYVRSHERHGTTFLKWLAGDYKPRL